MVNHHLFNDDNEKGGVGYDADDEEVSGLTAINVEPPVTDEVFLGSVAISTSIRLSINISLTNSITWLKMVPFGQRNENCWLGMIPHTWNTWRDLCLK